MLEVQNVPVVERVKQVLASMVHVYRAQKDGIAQQTINV
jgi:hypothetical protein